MSTAMSSTTTLPQLSRRAPKSTATCGPIMQVVPLPRKSVTPTYVRTLQSVQVPHLYDTFPQRIITSIDSSDFRRLPNRVNPLRPRLPQRRTAMMETVEPAWENQKRSDVMQRMNYVRYHAAYSKYPYGSPADKELYRRVIREHLKDQMDESNFRSASEFGNKSIESVIALQQDRQQLMEDSQKYFDHYNSMKAYRDENKKMMEARWEKERLERTDTLRKERELLRYTPINWSKTLK
ncbi:uncharacterized protein LOC141902342 [Tubulanus polymorphus]|uniref:uncharacterized protein LOC141902342 n=1 Tax=Tubulanus polymorphus TaxID=672921 RepID=UPI003DA5E872